MFTEQLLSGFSEHTINSALKYYQNQSIHDLNYSQRGVCCFINARVYGFTGRVYTLSITLQSFSKGLEITGDCSCMHQGGHCLHIVATLIAFKERYTQNKNESFFETRLQNWISETSRILDAKELACPPQDTQFVLHPIESPFEDIWSVCLKIKGDQVSPLIQTYLDASSVNKKKEHDSEISYCLNHVHSGFIEALLGTKCCFWFENDYKQLSKGKPFTGNLKWQHTIEGYQKLTISVNEAPKGKLVYIGQTLWLLHQSTLSEVILPITHNQLTHILSAPSIPWEQANRALEMLTEHPLLLEKLNACPLPIKDKKSILSCLPRLHFGEELLLTHKDITYFKLMTKLGGSEDNQSFKEEKAQRVPVVQLYFDYDVTTIPYTFEKDHLFIQENNILIRYTRDPKVEQEFIQWLLSIGLKPFRESLWSQNDSNSLANAFVFTEGDMHSQMKELLTKTLPTEHPDWHVTYTPYLSYNAIEPQSWYALVDEESQDSDWFNFELGIKINNQSINILPYLLEHIKKRANTAKQNEPCLIPLENGQLVSIPVERMSHILSTVYELYQEPSVNDQQQIQMKKIALNQLEDLTQGIDGLSWQDKKNLRDRALKLNFFDTPVELPKTLNASLRPYQLDGFRWLQFLRLNGLGGILADDMGLGKTLQTLTHLLKEKEEGRLKNPCLILAPTSLLGNWEQEAKKFTPDMKVMIFHGPQKDERFKQISQHDIVITTYTLFWRHFNQLSTMSYDYLILDEAQVIKNNRAKITSLVDKMSVPNRLCLTGTPLENHLGELWSLFNFLIPGFLGGYREFNKNFRTPIEKEQDHDRQKALIHRIKPFLLRRTKTEVAKDLPLKTEVIRLVELEEEQRDLYEAVRLSMHDKIQEEIAKNGVAKSNMVILDALLKLRQVCCDPRLLKLPSTTAERTAESAKLALLMDMVPQLVGEGRRILIFSQFTSMLDLIKEEFIKEDISFAELRGDTVDRSKPINDFQNGLVPVFLISLKAGGVGLNLTTADTVIHYDPWWNPAVENQATDRAYRIGQKKPVFVYKLIVKGTVEEKILRLQESKRQLSEGVLQGQGQVVLSAEDLKHLLDDDNSFEEAAS